mmetsp:Transcript_79007/g.118801  ORF Transcript_79007/g.118801 Transcript_79007/m.118801 type:complete len:1012 (+) Transcript_79007:44-3079(+)
MSGSDGVHSVSGDIAYLPPFPATGGSQLTTPKSSDRQAVAGGGVAPEGPVTESRLPVPEGKATQRLYLSSLPPQMAKALAVYDTDFDGILSEKDVAAAAADLQHMQSLAENEKEGKIPLDFFPDEVRKLLNEFDDNQDGELDVVEIMQGFSALQEERGRKKTLVRVVTGMVLFTAVLCISFAYLFAFVLEETEDTKVGSSVLRAKDGDGVVQMASAQFAVGRNGVLMNRPSPNADCGNDQCTDPLKLAASLQTGQLHSMLPDTDFEELRHMKITSDSSWIHFKVLATARYPALGSSTFGSVVVIYTHLGEITIDGEQLSFHESLDGAFSRAGFEVDSSGRRLLSEVEVIGMFNFLKQPIDQELINNLTSAVAFVNGLSVYYAEVRKAIVCRKVGDGCQLPSGIFVDHLEAWGVEKAIVAHEKHEVYSINGEPWARTEATKHQFALQTQHEIFNATHKLTYQTFTNINAQTFPFWCTLSESTATPPVVGASSAGGSASNSDMQVEPIDSQTLNGVLVNGWKVTFGGQELEYYQRDDSKLLYQINFGNMVYRFDSVSDEVASVSDGSLPPELDIEAILARCDPDVMKPQKWRDNEISNTYHPQPAWGLSLGDQSSPAITTVQYPNAAAFNAWFNGRFSDTAQATGNQKFCKIAEGESTIDDRLKYTFDKYSLCSGASSDDDLGAQCCNCGTDVCNNGAGPGNCKLSGASSDDDCRNFNCKAFCSGYSNFPTVVTVEVTGDSWECFEAQGSVQMVQDCSEVTSAEHPCTLHSFGALSLEMNLWECLEGSGSSEPPLPDYIALARQSNAAAGNLVFQDTAIQLSTEPTADFLYESCSLAPVLPDYQIGAVPSVVSHRGTGEASQTTSSSGAGSDVFSLTVNMKVDTMVAAAEYCGAKAPANSPPKVGFQLGYEVSGEVRWHLCANEPGSPNAFRLCGAAGGEGQVHSFNYARRIFPEPIGDTDFCGKGEDDVYRYKCTGCEHPIGFTDLVGSYIGSNEPLACTPGPNSRRRRASK